MFELEKERVFYYFEKISSIPRESGNEKAVSDWVLSWTKTLGLEAAQDAAFNLVIRKKASAGYETAAPVILQAHMDMVCEKTPESSHDFTKDPILLKVENDWLTSACKTSLGADNGIGMACAMAILEDDSLAHPPLEVIFTVEEETTFKGANSISPELFYSKRMINLDHADEKELIAGSCGGTGVMFTLPLSWEKCENSELGKNENAGYEAYEIKVCGLKGGHSGEDIHRGRGNAIQLLFRVLQEIVSVGGKVISVYGGTNRLAISREAQAMVLINDRQAAEEKITAMKAVFQKEFGKSAPDLDVMMESAVTKISENERICYLKDSEFEKMAAVVRLFPDGIISMSGDFPGQVDSSNNLGIIRAFPETGELQVISEIRGLYRTMVEDTKSRIEMLGSLFGAKVEYFAGYVSWEYAQDSCLRKTALDVYKKMFGEEMKVSTVHAGLEGGMFTEKEPEMDIISIGPSCQYFHSPMERVSIRSVKKFYGFLTALLAKLK
ncbi:MAG: beta-Ala-His dipeptidase [Lachnospiraceae bacterium]|nr:beta-Ala-His dipeptidase [Lachnospiraceae bacterium]